MKKTILSVLICLALLLASVQASAVQAHTPSPEEKLIEQVPDVIRERHHLDPPFEYSEEWSDGWHDPHFEENEEREYIPPTEESLRLTQEQVQAFNCVTVTDVPRVECEALVALYESTNGAGWTNNTNWLQTTTVGNWNGITVSEGHVDKISFSFNQLTGAIPAELGSLANLTNLVLNDNQLTGMIPVTLSNLVNLNTLFLPRNQLSGTIPAELGNLANLEVLSFSGNQLTGTIPVELSNLVNLNHLYLPKNQLTGTIPAELGNLVNLNKLSLASNQLTGEIPSELGNLTNLWQLWLNGNQLTGTIPAELGNIKSLDRLSLSHNQLAGTIPAELGNLSYLIHLDLSHNLLEGEIPGSLSNLFRLCVDGKPEDTCFDWYKTDLGYNLFNVPQPTPISYFLYDKDPDWDKTQGVKGVFPGATGGTLVSNDGRTTVTVPAGAVDGNLTLILKPTPPASGFRPPLVSTGNDFEALAFDANGEVSQFNQALTFTLKYNDSDIGLMPEENLALHYYDVNAKQWRDTISTCSSGSYIRNPEQNQFSLPVCHLTDFAVVGEGFTNYFPALLK